jgi:hypothetical protein
VPDERVGIIRRHLVDGGAVSEYLDRAETSGLSWPLPGV